MTKLKINLVRIWHVIALLCFIAVLFIVVVHSNSIPLTTIEMVSFFLILLLLFHFMKNIDFNEKIIFFILLIYFVVMLFLAYQLRVTPSWDFGTIYNEVISMIENNQSHIMNTAYFIRYMNNLPCFFIVYGLFKFCYLFNITDYLLIGIVFNVVIITLSQGIFYLCLKKIWNKNIALYGLMLSLVCVGFIGYSPIFYTDTFVLPIVNLILLSYIYLYNDFDSDKNIYLISLFLGILISIGFQLKATIVIMFIAIFLHLLFSKKIKKMVLCFFVICVSFVSFYKAYSFVFEQTNLLCYTQQEFDEYNFPYTHWIMMSLNDEGFGGYNRSDVDYTMSFPSRESKKNANIEEIQRRVNAFGIKGFINHTVKKIHFTWGDGTYYSYNVLARKPINHTFLHDVMLSEGQYNQIYRSLVNSFFYALLCFICISFLYGVFEKDISYMSCLRLILFGIFLFLLIWETRSRYIFHMIPVIYILAIDGIYNLDNSSFSFLKKEDNNRMH